MWLVFLYNLRWRGNWSELDTQHWTPTFRQALHYEPEDAANFDNGVFWIDYKSLQHYFDVLYMNWDPGMFPHSTSLHGAWAGSRGPAKDLISMGDNPQYRLDLGNSSRGALSGSSCPATSPTSRTSGTTRRTSPS